MSESLPPEGHAPAEGLRERKRRATRQRIAEVGLQLFLTNGYESTTLDAIAAEAGISRRTFFSYFKSKDDVILSWQEAGWASIHSELLQVSPALLAAQGFMALSSRQDLAGIERCSGGQWPQQR
mgnify:CR=1 FL=1